MNKIVFYSEALGRLEAASGIIKRVYENSLSSIEAHLPRDVRSAVKDADDAIDLATRLLFDEIKTFDGAK